MVSVTVALAPVAAAAQTSQATPAAVPRAPAKTAAKAAKAAAKPAAKAAKMANTAANCDWVDPGHSPFMGDVVAAVDHYTDIPAPVRERLKARMAARSYDEIVSIRRDSIVGLAAYEPGIRQMHFGDRGRICGNVTRNTWTPQMEERGLVYCEAGECILVPTVCRNVSRITRLPGGGAGVGGPGGVAGVPGSPELLFDPPAAGPLPGPVSVLNPPPGSTPAPLNPGVGPGPTFVPVPPYYPGGGGGPTIFVPVPVVPEPQSVLLMLAGLGVVGALAAVRRRRVTR